MNVRTAGACLLGLALALAGAAGQGMAGAGQAAAWSAPTSPPEQRLARRGYGQTHDWHAQRRLQVEGEAVSQDRGRPVSVSGRSGWVCTPAGAGHRSTCRAR